ncbi:ATP-dependent helicase [Jatrophihabitans sp. YIM 134969]
MFSSAAAELAWDHGLDDAQFAAVTHGTGPLVVVAGAGTGKTRTLTSRVARLLETGVRPERVLLLTFTRRAAAEMLARAAATCGDPSAARRVWGGTFHAVAHRVITEFADVLGLPEVSVLDPGDVADLLDLLRDDHGLTATGGSTRMPRAAALADVYSRAVNTGRPVRTVLDTDFPWISAHADAVTALLRAYVARKRERGLLDFDDLLLTWRALLDHPATGDLLRERWDHVLVDEYQDVNAVQVDIVRALCPDGRGLTVVGDDAQAVYGFRGAASGHLLALTERWPETTVVTLERNFRSRQPVLDLANVVRPGDGVGQVVLRSHRDSTADDAVPAARPRLVRCHDPADEARQVVDSVLAAVDSGGQLRDHAVLMRSSSHSDLLEVELTSRHVPFVKYGGLKFLEAAHVKDFLAALRVTHNIRDEVAWFRLLRLHEGIGPARARSLLTALIAAADSEGVAADDLNDLVASAPAASRTALAETLLGLFDTHRSAEVAQQVAGCVAVVRPLVAAKYADSPARVEDLDRLAEAASVSADLAAYVAELTLDPPASTSDHAKPPHLDEDYLTLSTVHSAKGLEWPSVHVLHAVDGAFPSDMALAGSNEGIEEEQRLFYVALTRARDDLAVYTPLRMPHHRKGRDDRHSYAPQSRFLSDDAVATMAVTMPPSRESSRPAALVDARVEIPTLDALLG